MTFGERAAGTKATQHAAAMRLATREAVHGSPTRIVSQMVDYCVRDIRNGLRGMGDIEIKAAVVVKAGGNAQAGCVESGFVRLARRGNAC